MARRAPGFAQWRPDAAKHRRRLRAALPPGNLDMLPRVATETEERDGKSEETNQPRPQAGSRTGRRRAGLRGPLRGEEDRKGGGSSENGRQEGRQRAQARGEKAWPLSRRAGLASRRDASPSSQGD